MNPIKTAPFLDSLFILDFPKANVLLMRPRFGKAKFGDVSKGFEKGFVFEEPSKTQPERYQHLF